MKKTINFCVFAAIVLFSCIGYAGEFPKPSVGSGCNDNPWNVKGHWSNLQELQYGAEVINKGDKGFKLKIVQRKGSKIIPYFCNYFNEAVTTDQINEWYSSGDAKFRSLPIKDAGNHKTVTFWLYR